MGNMAFLYGNGGEVNITVENITTYTRKTGNVNLGGTELTIDCGFQPDAIFFSMNEKTMTSTGGYKTFQIGTGTMFPELSSTKNYFCSMLSQNNTYMYSFWGSQTTSGFTAAYTRATMADSSIVSTSKQFSYVAVKYT